MAIEQRTPAELRQLVTWYRALAEKAGSVTIWESRQRRAEELDDEASRIEAADRAKEITTLRAQAARCRLAASTSTNGGHLADRALIDLADKLEREAAELEEPRSNAG